MNKRRLTNRWYDRVMFSSCARFSFRSKMSNAVPFNVVDFSTNSDEDSTASVVDGQSIVVYSIGNHLDNYLD